MTSSGVVPTISVIVPAYRAEDVIDASMGSIAAQTVPVHEVIVVDDGSDDATSERARTWASHLPIEVHRLDENIGAGRGAGGARAVGIERATGDMIALLDVDDVWLPDHLDVMLAEHRRHGGLVTANHYLWVPGVELGTGAASELVPIPPPEEQRLAILSENFVFVSTLFRRDLYDRVGPMRNIRCEDWDLWIKMVDAGAVVSMPDQVTALYRQAPNSVSGTDKLLIGDIDLLEEHRYGRPDDEVEVIDAALRRRRAKQLFLDGVEHAEGGRILAARKAWLHSMRVDPSLRANNSNLNGRVVVRSAASLVAPRTMMKIRRDRQSDPAFVVGGRATSGNGSRP